MMASRKSIMIICVAVVLGFVLFLMMPTDVNAISNATIDENSGDVAFCYFDNSAKVAVLNIAVFDKTGGKLYGKSIVSSSGFADMCFYEGVLCINLSRTNEVLCFDRAGNQTVVDVNRAYIKEQIELSEWNGSLFRKEYTLGEYTTFVSVLV